MIIYNVALTSVIHSMHFRLSNKKKLCVVLSCRKSYFTFSYERVI